jgi:hypothetical protein
MRHDKKTISQELIAEVERVLREFNTLSGIDSATTHLDIGAEGKFDIRIQARHRSVRVTHGRTYDSAGTIDIGFVDKDRNTAYVIVMTECEVEFFPMLLRNALNVSKDFLYGRYRIEHTRLLGVLKRTHIVFDREDLVYVSAIKRSTTG